MDGSGGAGRQRGGMALRRVYRAEAPCRLRLDGARLRSAPWGLDGGRDGARGEFIVSGGAGFEHGQGALAAGDIVTIITPGAGGYGPASARDPAARARDIREGRLTEAAYQEA